MRSWRSWPTRCGATPVPTTLSGAGSCWPPALAALRLPRASTSTCSSLCLIMGGMASRLCVNIASCRPWARPNSRALALPAPSLRPSSSGQQPRRRPGWLWTWAASTGAGRRLAGLDGGYEEGGPVGRAGRPRLRAGPGVGPRATQGVPATESLLHRGCRGAHGWQGRSQVEMAPGRRRWRCQVPVALEPGEYGTGAVT
uniref:Uncharacterized protein n=1 Tax=Balaenoptera musculus TaxID=9771 RepID=A0A8C0DWL5_BALMU